MIVYIFLGCHASGYHLFLVSFCCFFQSVSQSINQEKQKQKQKTKKLAFYLQQV